MMVLFYRKIRMKFRERKDSCGVDCALERTIRAEPSKKGRKRAMWISLFTFASGVAVCLSIAAVMMQSEQRALRR